MASGSLLRPLGFSARLGLTVLVLTLLGGLAVSGIYMAMHHENRDERPGLTMRDVTGHYAGVSARSPLLEAIEAGHPEDLPEESRRVLVEWLESDRISEDYDNLDLGAYAPAEILAVSCLDCHSRQATGENAYPELPLDYWSDIQAVAFSTEILPVSLEVLAASTHTHSISLAVMGLVSAGLLLATGWPRKLVNPLVLLMGLGLAADLSGWWLARLSASVVPMIVVGGAVFAAAVTLALLMVTADLWRPGGKAGAPSAAEG